MACTPSKIVIMGRIVNENTLPIDSAEVVTEPPTDVVSTDVSGFFRIDRAINMMGQIEDIKAGTYQINITKDGFEPLAIQVIVERGEFDSGVHTMKAEKALIKTVAPTKTDDPDNVKIGAPPMMGQ